jgi:hypothetical protein
MGCNGDADFFMNASPVVVVGRQRMTADPATTSLLLTAPTDLLLSVSERIAVFA